MRWRNGGLMRRENLIWGRWLRMMGMEGYYVGIFWARVWGWVMWIMLKCVWISWFRGLSAWCEIWKCRSWVLMRLWKWSTVHVSRTFILTIIVRNIIFSILFFFIFFLTLDFLQTIINTNFMNIFQTTWFNYPFHTHSSYSLYSTLSTSLYSSIFPRSNSITVKRWYTWKLLMMPVWFFSFVIKIINVINTYDHITTFLL